MMPQRLSNGDAVYTLSKNILSSTTGLDTKPTAGLRRIVPVFMPQKNFAFLTSSDDATGHTH
jgi:hypothetical protein